MIFSIAKETGWSKDYIMNKVSYVNLQMMMADAPRLTRYKVQSSEFKDEEKIIADLVNKMPEDA